MNRTDRLLAIVLALQAKGERRAEDLAALFETSKRTIYRDIQALCEAGVPVIAMPGRGYMLDEGYFLPPLSFSIDEATLLLLGMDVMADSFDADYRRVAQMAQSKIEGVLPPFTRERAVWLRASLMFVAMDALNSAQIERLRQIRRAIFNQQRVRFVYHTRYPDDRAPEQRDADPYALVSVDGVWYLRGYCHLRRGLRIFRLSRISELQILAQTFQRPATVLPPDNSSDPREFMIRLLFAPSAAAWVMEDTLYFITTREPTPDGLLVTLHVRLMDEAVPWVLGWGQQVRVLEPPALRERIAQEAHAMWIQHRGAL